MIYILYIQINFVEIHYIKQPSLFFQLYENSKEIYVFFTLNYSPDHYEI